MAYAGFYHGGGSAKGKVFGNGAAASFQTARGLGRAVSSPSGVQGGTLPSHQFSYILSALDTISCCILVAFCTTNGRSYSSPQKTPSVCHWLNNLCKISPIKIRDKRTTNFWKVTTSYINFLLTASPTKSMCVGAPKGCRVLYRVTASPCCCKSVTLVLAI